MNIFLADFILFFHFFIAFFVILGLFFPIGYKLNLALASNFYIRLIHLLLIGIIFFETILGFICPLTIIENSLRGNPVTKSFVSKWLGNILFWDFSLSYFILIYFICFLWTIFIWFYFPPKRIKN